MVDKVAVEPQRCADQRYYQTRYVKFCPQELIPTIIPL